MRQRGILYLILQNWLYRSELTHKGNVYPRQHEPIIDAELWTVIQAKLAANRKAGPWPQVLKRRAFCLDCFLITPATA